MGGEVKCQEHRKQAGGLYVPDDKKVRKRTYDSVTD